MPIDLIGLFQFQSRYWRFYYLTKDGVSIQCFKTTYSNNFSMPPTVVIMKVFVHKIFCKFFSWINDWSIVVCKPTTTRGKCMQRMKWFRTRPKSKKTWVFLSGWWDSSFVKHILCNSFILIVAYYNFVVCLTGANLRAISCQNIGFQGGKSNLQFLHAFAWFLPIRLSLPIKIVGKNDVIVNYRQNGSYRKMMSNL